MRSSKHSINRCVIAYIDDILIYFTSYDDHVHHIKTVLTQLLQHQLYAKAEKCEFHKDIITLLGYVICQRGVEMDSSKVNAVTDWPEPTTIKKLQRFLGFANFYCRFIHNYSSITNLLTALEEWHHWLEEAHHPFLVLTDHRNLKYLHNAKRLNPRQA
ncbi:hypothetical protein QTP70_007850 [Hemibagrus guttatus]|uniref:ribonuclease H n=1 Tax=Hemibagrus guttatus TaxID=175788 RepID=A0AAE0QRE3_9TELE|nr:hypothetical protein QTP70_007850 [Hemibagrus guttatus]